MRIHVNCPGMWRSDLNSPERGESRWAQNLARMLGMAGHEVYASSYGEPFWVGRPVPNVTLINETMDMRILGWFDLHIDPSWWDGKIVPINAEKKVSVKWSLEDYMKKTILPDNHYIFYPYEARASIFMNDLNYNKDRTFFMPIPLCDKFEEPKFSNKGILWPSKGFDVESGFRGTADFVLKEVLYPLLDADPTFFIIWMMYHELVKTDLDIRVRKGKDKRYPSCAYNIIIDLIRQCKIAVPVNHPGSILECGAYGVASLIWEEAGFFPEVASYNGLLIERGATKERIKDVILQLLNNEQVYTKYVKDLQYELRHHETPTALSIFNDIMKKIF